MGEPADNEITSQPAAPPLHLLRPFERFAFRVMRWLDERRFSRFWQHWVLGALYGVLLGRRVRVHGLDRLARVPAGAPILLVSNHRTFFDQFVLAWVFVHVARLRRRLNFPVRANFFYENPLGLFICAVSSGGAMFPPFFRKGQAMPFNRMSLAILAEKLRQPGNLVGFHPEGTRNKTADPYTLLPAQPGAGELALKARPVVVPAFVTGLSNSALRELWAGLRGTNPIRMVFGAPIDLSGFPDETRPVHHKRCADLFVQRIAALGEEEHALARVQEIQSKAQG